MHTRIIYVKADDRSIELIFLLLLNKLRKKEISNKLDIVSYIMSFIWKYSISSLRSKEIRTTRDETRYYPTSYEAE